LVGLHANALLSLFISTFSLPLTGPQFVLHTRTLTVTQTTNSAQQTPITAMTIPVTQQDSTVLLNTKYFDQKHHFMYTGTTATVEWQPHPTADIRNCKQGTRTRTHTQTHTHTHTHRGTMNSKLNHTPLTQKIVPTKNVWLKKIGTANDLDIQANHRGSQIMNCPHCVDYRTNCCRTVHTVWTAEQTAVELSTQSGLQNKLL
jgi:hypothetical protein